jgi:hypothetical protein
MSTERYLPALFRDRLQDLHNQSALAHVEAQQEYQRKLEDIQEDTANQLVCIYKDIARWEVDFEFGADAVTCKHCGGTGDPETVGKVPFMHRATCTMGIDQQAYEQSSVSKWSFWKR